jgi:hypothetical protein
MLTHLAPDTGDSHVPHIERLGDCTRFHGDCRQRPGGGIFLADSRIGSAQPAGQPNDPRAEGRCRARRKDEHGKCRDAGAHPEQVQEAALAGRPEALTRTSERPSPTGRAAEHVYRDESLQSRSSTPCSWVGVSSGTPRQSALSRDSSLKW